MARRAIAILYLIVMVAAVVGVDIAFLRNHGAERLAANVGIVVVFAAVYLRFGGRPWSLRRR